MAIPTIAPVPNESGPTALICSLDAATETTGALVERDDRGLEVVDDRLTAKGKGVETEIREVKSNRAESEARGRVMVVKKDPVVAAVVVD